MSWLELLSGVCLIVGSIFCVIGGIGLLKFPDFYVRTHAASVTDTMGAGLVIAGLMILGGLSQVTLKLALILVFLAVTSPTAAHALVKAAFAHKVRVDLEIPPVIEGGGQVAARPAADAQTAGDAD